MNRLTNISNKLELYWIVNAAKLVNIHPKENILCRSILPNLI